MDNNVFTYIISGKALSDPAYSKYYVQLNESYFIEITNESIDNIMLDNEINYPYDIYLSNISFLGELHIKNGKFRNLFITDSNGLKSFSTNGSHFQDIKISSSNSEVIRIGGGRCNNIMLYNESANFINIVGSKIGSLRFMRIKSAWGVKMTNANINSVIFDEAPLTGEKAIAKLNVRGGNYDYIVFEEPSEVNSLVIEAGVIGSLYLSTKNLKDVFIKELNRNFRPLAINKIVFKEINKANIDISEVAISTISFLNCYASKDSVFRLTSVTTEKLEFIDFANYGQFTFNNLKLQKGDFIIKNSDLGKSTLINCQIDESRLNFESSKITELFITGTKMPSQISGNDESKRLAYGQIKKVYENRGDAIEASIFLSKEMNAYYETLSWKTDKEEIINLFFNKLSTNHGQSWKRGLGSALVFSALFYWMYLLILGFRLNLNGNLDVFSYFIEFVNPVHKTDYIINELQLKPLDTPYIGIARIWEGISRIFIAYFIYQLIQAFRKHGKK